MIEVILLEKIERLGSIGDVVKVKPGFARNYLLPQKKALRATKTNLELFEKQRAELEARNAHLRSEAEKIAKNIDGINVVVVRQASETGQLYGSVSARDIAEAAKEAGHNIERSAVQIEKPIKAIGLYQVKVRLHAEVSAIITVNVARSPEEAEVQAEKEAARKKEEAKKAKAEAEKSAIEEIGKEKTAKKTKKKEKQTEKTESEPVAEKAKDKKTETKKQKTKKATKKE